MRYSDTIKWLYAIWNTKSSEAKEVVEEIVEVDLYTYTTLTVHLKGGRSIVMRAQVDKGTDITEHNLWKGMTKWLNDIEDNAPYFFTSDGGNYNTCVIKSEVVQIELNTEKDTD